jgi:hypothetical protein
MIRAGIATALAIAAAALLLGGCGSGADTVTVTETSIASTTSSTAGSTATTDTPATSTGAGDGGTPAADRTVTKLTGFTSPSGNIGCYIDRGSVRCDIDDRDWSPPKAPKSCDLDYGQGIELRAGGAAAFVCAGDTALGGGDVLGYGSSIAAGLLRCESEESGMTCRDTETGRGFTISKQAYEIF